MSAVRVAITGAAGRMGQRLVALTHQGEHTVVTGATEVSTHGKIKHDAGLVAGIGEIGVTISPSLALDIGRADVVIDFSSPEATVAHARIAGEARVPMVIGTTGMSTEQAAAVASAMEGLAYVKAPNFSVGVNLVLKLLSTAASILSDEYDIEVVEMHHRHKVDAPSGTALRMAEVLAEARGVSLETHGVYARHGHTGARSRGTIGMQTLRGGDVAGDHTVIFAADGERVEIGHRASGRDTFASGAIRAARWVVAQTKPGQYDMADVLGL
ncbi:MAG: 4-hydroxy-tetrahydrodipicolinate reductase [Nitrospirota bacterium]|nr:4-hydroxy-tetrahydrodipicolinate reductase [Nitrospirota bacterium]